MYVTLPMEQSVRVCLQTELAFCILEQALYPVKHITGRERLIRSHSSARFSFELSGNSN